MMPARMDAIFLLFIGTSGIVEDFAQISEVECVVIGGYCVKLRFASFVKQKCERHTVGKVRGFERCQSFGDVNDSHTLAVFKGVGAK